MGTLFTIKKHNKSKIIIVFRLMFHPQVLYGLLVDLLRVNLSQDLPQVKDSRAGWVSGSQRGTYVSSRVE